MKELKAKGEKDESVKALGEKGATYTLSRNMSMSAMAEDKENAKGNLSSVHLLLYYSPAQGWVIHKSMSLKYEHPDSSILPFEILKPKPHTLNSLNPKL